MAKKSKEEILSFVREKFKDDTSDEVLEFIEDLTDTIDDDDDDEDWKSKYEANDKMWREKYKARFFASEKEEEEEEEEDEEKVTFDDLFTEKKED